MLIAVSADARGLSGAVSGHFEACRRLLLVSIDDSAADTVIKSVEDVETGPEADGRALARLVVERDCEAVITGSLTQPVFDILADGCVTRYSGPGLSVLDALRAMNQNALGFIRDDACRGEHGGGSCDCGEDHE